MLYVVKPGDIMAITMCITAVAMWNTHHIGCGIGQEAGRRTRQSAYVFFPVFSCAFVCCDVDGAGLSLEPAAGSKGKFNKGKGKDAFKGSKGGPDKPFGKGLYGWTVVVL
jgi:hypothetical protein